MKFQFFVITIFNGDGCLSLRQAIKPVGFDESNPYNYCFGFNDLS